MGKIILCRGQRTDKPYVTPQTDIKLYSAEELCYYIYNNIYLIGQNRTPPGTGVMGLFYHANV